MTPPAGPPLIPKDLLEWLEQKFPVEMPRPEETERSIWIRVGHVDLVRTLRVHYDRQNTTTGG